jgi:hypothetical protein
MGMVRLALITCISAIASAQPPTGLSFVNTEAGIVGVKPSLRTDPVTSALARRFIASSRIREMNDGRTFFSRIVLDRSNRVYLGYELLIEKREAGTYLATFGRLGVTPLDIASVTPLKFPQDRIDPSAGANGIWTMLQLPEIPEPRALQATDTIRIDLFVDPTTSEKLIDDIRIVPPGTAPAVVRPVPTVSGTLRDFSITDAELQIVQPRLTLNRKLQDGLAWRYVHGPLVWLYFPDHGRFILSLIPHPTLGFKKAGEVRGGVLTFNLDQDTIRIESFTPIAGGDAPYNLYVLHDEDWAPASEAQKFSLAAGTVDVGELAALKRK